MAGRLLQNRHSGSSSLLLVAGLIVALLALVNVMALSNWHASLTDHDDVAADAVHMAPSHHNDHIDTAAEGTGESPAIDLHALTHAMIHGLAGLVPNLDVCVRERMASADWFAGRSFALSGIAPEGLLRPPQV
jgi:hypothetical protein